MRSWRLGVCLGLVSAAACGLDEYGDGVGWPPSSPVERPAPSPLSLTEVFVAAGDASTHFAELALAADAAAVALDGYTACWVAGCVPLAGAVAPGGRAVVEIGGLGLPASAGELAIVDPEGVTRAYLAWGADPVLFRSPLATAALLAGVTAAGDFVPLPFPMPSGVAVASEGAQRGCAVPSPGDVALLNPALCAAQPSPLEITELLPALDGGASGWVELFNPTSVAVRLFGVRLCQLPGCVTFGIGQKVGALSRVLVHLGRERPTDPTDPASTDAAQLFFSAAEPVRPAGELALLAPGPAAPVDEPAALLAFVRYGGTLGQLSPTAVVAGLWPEVFDAALAPRIAGESLSRDLSGALGGVTWNPTRAPTPLLANEDLGQASDTWGSCSFPRPWRRAAPSQLVVVRLERTAPAVLQLAYRGAPESPLPLAGWSLDLGGAPWPLGGELARDAALFVELDPEGDGCAADRLCWQDAAAVVPEHGELALWQEVGGVDELRQYLAWGTAARLRADAAVDAGVWPLTDCALPSLDDGRFFILGAGEVGDSPADYQ